MEDPDEVEYLRSKFHNEGINSTEKGILVSETLMENGTTLNQTLTENIVAQDSLNLNPR